MRLQRTHPEVGLTPGRSGLAHGQEPPSASVPQLERGKRREEGKQERQLRVPQINSSLQQNQ